MSPWSNPNRTKHYSKLAERSWNVYENKAPKSKEREEAGMSRKAEGSYVLVGGILCFNVDNKSVQWERDKALFKTEGMIIVLAPANKRRYNAGHEKS